MRRLSIPFVISFVICASLIAGTPVFNDTQCSKPSQQVRLMDFLRLYVSASDPDGFPLIYDWAIKQDPTAKVYFSSNQQTTFAGPGAELAFPWISSSDAANTPYVGQSVQVVVTAKHENAADGPETASWTFNITLSGINHPPVPGITGTFGTATNRIPTGNTVIANSGSSYDPDPNDTYRSDWTVGTGTGGTILGLITPIGSEGSTMSFAVPNMIGNVDLQILLQLSDGMHQVRASAVAYLKPADTTPPVTGNTAPNVTVTTPVNKTVGENLVLHGVVTDNDGDEVDLQCAWLQAGGKAVSPTAINATPVAIPAPAKQWAVTVDLGPLATAGTFQVRLTAQERDTADHKMSAADATINVQPLSTNEAPTARIKYQVGSGLLQPAPSSTINVASPATILLDGTGSTDDGGSAALTYVWTKSEILTGGSVTLSNSNTNTASLSVGNATQGTFTVTLQVTDEQGLSSTEAVSFNITTLKLTAKVAVKSGATILTSAAEAGTVITLDGSGSTSSDGTQTHMTYSWSQQEGPPVSLVGMDSAKTTFVAPGVNVDGTSLKFQLNVADTQTGETAHEQAIVTVNVGATYFAQVGFGTLADGELRTVLLLVNNTAQAADNVILEFFGSDGQALQAIIDNQWWTNQPFSVPARFSKRLEFGGMAGGARLGWARVKSGTKLDGLALYQVVDSTTREVKHETSVFSSARNRSFTTYFNPTEETALAVANPTDHPVQVTISIVDYVNGQESVIVTKRLFPDLADGKLPARQHGARFVDSSLLGELPPTFKQGALRIEADGEIIITTLKTKEGVVFSALPLAGAK